jgi:hypothetical protein
VFSMTTRSWLGNGCERRIRAAGIASGQVGVDKLAEHGHAEGFRTVRCRHRGAGVVPTILGHGWHSLDRERNGPQRSATTTGAGGPAYATPPDPQAHGRCLPQTVAGWGCEHVAERGAAVEITHTLGARER